jgi:hypothetical protein
VRPLTFCYLTKGVCMAPPSVVPAVGDATLVAAALHHVVLDKGLTNPSSGLNL